ncbi:hypothetical protein [Candidatus Burkholderia verschuerenii]|uniref:hypothetical protein n=1 Tax=Candidatus Burkholderia verschuerenii TaxID=242163 RepID=UPI000B014FD6|nr:hypothetical protein [Candidatus Burkholderia verschuerenii]
MQLASEALALAHVPIDPEVLAAGAQDGFHLRIAPEAFRHTAHLPLDLLACLVVLPTTQRLTLPL